MITEIVLAALALSAGIAGGWWMFGSKRQGESDPSSKAEKEAFAHRAERMMMAIGQVHDVASRVAFDVGNHSSEVGRISAELEVLKNSDSGTFAEPAVTVLSQVLSANEKLQERLAAAEEKLQAQAQEIANQQTAANTDSLTSLPNRRALDREIVRRVAEWKTSQTPFTLMVVDVDMFKQFNDTHGHQAGDEVLRQIAHKLRECTRDQDVACRYGGEEFVVVMPATDLRAASVVGLRARRTIEGLRVAWQGKRLNVTVSFGLAQMHYQDDAAGLLRRADDALYAAKKAGRNSGFLHDGQGFRSVDDVVHAPRQSPKPAASLPEIQLLNKLPGRDELEQELERRLSDSQQYGLPLSLIMVRLPGCDSLLAEHGERVTEILHDAVAVMLHETIREMDFLARDKSDHFTIVLPGSTDAEAQLVAKRIRAILAGRRIQAGPAAVSLSLQMGQASYRKGDGVNSLRMRAETDLTRCQKQAATQSERTG